MVLSRAVHARTLSSQLAFAVTSASLHISASSAVCPTSFGLAQSTMRVAMSCLTCIGFQTPSNMWDFRTISSVIFSTVGVCALTRSLQVPARSWVVDIRVG
ncbi:hypothetical protein PF002_g21370 [Phytophthora fragariae]|uniref:Uncharacterized protein n=1 Tax=Phytophthora fragariae TaxID=53985 RepID=A0A6A3XG00_9STRA|nr:hypothetical protein PF002_g21370 [Phytophthora fragariae]